MVKSSFAPWRFAIGAMLIATSPLSAQTFRSGTTSQPWMAGFGLAVAVGDGEVFVGEPSNVMRPGIVYVYRRSGSGWTEAAQLKAGDAKFGDGFGSALAVEGNTLAIGAVSQNAVFIFQKGANGAWTQAARLTSGDTASSSFGAALALRNDVLLAGAPVANERTGTVHVFRRTGNAWAISGRIDAPDAAAGNVFGAALAFDGTTAFIGAPGRSERAGNVYAFTLQNGAWSASGSLSGPGIEKDGLFGAAIRIEEGGLFIGAPLADGGTGEVFVFRMNPRTNQWVAAGRVLPFDGSRAQFGASLASTPDALWVGAPGGGRGGAGGVYRFERADNSFVAARRLVPQGGGRGGFATVAAGGNIAVAGAPGMDSGLGAAVIYDVNGPELAGTRVESPAESLDPIVGSRTECTGNKVSVFDCGEVDLMGFLPNSAIGAGRGIRLNDIWGWTDAQSGKEYALVGRTDGTAFVDVSDPSNPVFVGQLMRTEGSPVSVWRDIKVYKDHAYIVADASQEHGVQVFDLSRLREFNGTPITFQPETTYHDVHSAHNIVINEESGFAYAVGSGSGGETCGGGLHMIDIREPKNPKFAGCFADPQTGRAGTGYSHDAQCVTYKGPDADYRGHEICMGSNETMLSIADVTDKKNPKPISRIAYPNVGYSHQGWFTEDHRYFLMDDELDEINQNNSGTPFKGTRTLIWDVSDLDDPQLVTEYFGNSPSSDHNLYIKGNLVYQSNYVGGLRVLDITDPKKPVEVGYFDTVPWSPDAPGFDGSWSNFPFFASGNVVVTSGREGLFIVRKRPVRPVS